MWNYFFSAIAIIISSVSLILNSKENKYKKKLFQKEFLLNYLTKITENLYKELEKYEKSNFEMQIINLLKDIDNQDDYFNKINQIRETQKICSNNILYILSTFMPTKQVYYLIKSINIKSDYIRNLLICAYDHKDKKEFLKKKCTSIMEYS